MATEAVRRTLLSLGVISVIIAILMTCSSSLYSSGLTFTLQTSQRSEKSAYDGGKSYADKDGEFRRPASSFRDFISSEPGARFPPEKGRYVLYINYGCPWAHRANIVHSLKGLEDIVDIVVTGINNRPNGWSYDGKFGSAEADPLHGFKLFRDLYLKADPDYTGRFTVPVIWDKKTETIVNNESSEIIRIFATGFDDLLPAERREVNRPGGGLYPEDLHKEIDELNEWVYDKINNGVYKTGFASNQEAYDQHFTALFEALDRVEDHMSQPGHSPYLFGESITEADIRLYTTMVRFDAAYHTTFKCNLKMIRLDYPHIHDWLRTLYWDTSDRTNGGAFQKTTYFDAIKTGYANAARLDIVPMGPLPHVLPLEGMKQVNGLTA